MAAREKSPKEQANTNQRGRGEGTQLHPSIHLSPAAALPWEDRAPQCSLVGPGDPVPGPPPSLLPCHSTQSRSRWAQEIQSQAFIHLLQETLPRALPDGHGNPTPGSPPPPGSSLPRCAWWAHDPSSRLSSFLPSGHDPKPVQVGNEIQLQVFYSAVPVGPVSDIDSSHLSPGTRAW